MAEEDLGSCGCAVGDKFAVSVKQDKKCFRNGCAIRTEKGDLA